MYAAHSFFYGLAPFLFETTLVKRGEVCLEGGGGMSQNPLLSLRVLLVGDCWEEVFLVMHVASVSMDWRVFLD